METAFQKAQRKRKERHEDIDAMVKSKSATFDYESQKAVKDTERKGKLLRQKYSTQVTPGKWTSK